MKKLIIHCLDFADSTYVGTVGKIYAPMFSFFRKRVANIVFLELVLVLPFHRIFCEMTNIQHKIEKTVIFTNIEGFRLSP